MWIIILGALVVIVAISLLIVCPPSRGKMPVLKDKNGNPVQNTLSEKRWIDVDGASLGVMLMAKDTTKPVLMVCGGGPGIPQYLLEDLYPSVLADEFIVCYWDYRGAGLSYAKDLRAEDMTTERYLVDAMAVADYLSERFAQDKIYIMGHSFGTYIALNAVSRYPDKFRAYIAMSQVCNQKESEILAFDYMLQQYQQNGNAEKVKALSEYHIRESDEEYERYFHSGLRDTAMHDLGVGTARDMHSVITGLFFPSLRCTVYTQAERINLWKGKAFSNQFPVVASELKFHAREEIPRVDIPIYFVVGKYDYTCCASLQEEYYACIEAPLKRLFLFENSAHSPIYEEPEKALEVLKAIKADT